MAELSKGCTSASSMFSIVHGTKYALQDMCWNNLKIIAWLFFAEVYTSLMVPQSMELHMFRPWNISGYVRKHYLESLGKTDVLAPLKILIQHLCNGPCDSNLKMLLKWFWYVAKWWITGLPWRNDELQTISNSLKLFKPLSEVFYFKQLLFCCLALSFITLSNVTQFYKNSHFMHLFSSVSHQHFRKYNLTLRAHIHVNIMFF